MELGHYLELLRGANGNLAAAYQQTAGAHADETEVFYVGQKLARQCEEQVTALRPFRDRYGAQVSPEPQAFPSTRFHGPRGPGLGLLRDLQDLYLMVAECHICWTVVDGAAQGARDTELQAVVQTCSAQTATQQAWLRTQLVQSSVQALVVA